MKRHLQLPAAPEGSFKDPALPFAATAGWRAYRQLDAPLRAYEANRGAWLLFSADYPRSNDGKKYFLLARRRVETFMDYFREQGRRLHEVIGGSEKFDGFPHKVFVDYDVHGDAVAPPNALYDTLHAAQQLWGDHAKHVAVFRAGGSPNFHAVFYRVVATGLHGPSSVDTALCALVAQMRRNGAAAAAENVDLMLAPKKSMRAPFACKAGGAQELAIMKLPYDPKDAAFLLGGPCANALRAGLVNYFDDDTFRLDMCRHCSTVNVAPASRPGKKRRRRGGPVSRNSPYPRIDHFIAQELRGLSPPGRIRKVTFEAMPRGGHLITYWVTGNRRCANVGREHRSNNIMLVVNTAKNTYVQRCLDPQCAGYSSKPRRINDDA